jgi:MFS superfamily sulfate permease-like transporter
METNKTKSNVLQTYISFTVFTFDILDFITITFVTVPLSMAINPVKSIEKK